MYRPGPEAEPQFALPIRQITFMLVVVALVAVGAYLSFPRLESVFLANPWLNGVIVAVFLIGVLACFWQVQQLINSVRWIKAYASEQMEFDPRNPPRLLASLAALLKGRGARMQISATSSRSILDSVATRIDEARDITRYIVNLLIFLGLLGTFYGLATTVPAVVETIRSLAPQEGESSADIFTRLMSGLEQQLGGMGTAFASSLLGLAGSLIVGLLELFASHGQNRFYRELEDWLSTITRLGLGSDAESGSGEQSLMAAVLDQMADQMDGLQRLFVESDQGRAALDARLGSLATSVEALTARLDQGAAGDTRTMERIADGQQKLIEVLENQAAGEHVDAEARMRLRSIDVQLLRILEEMSAGRQESLADLRGDLAALTRAIRALAGGPGRAGS